MPKDTTIIIPFVDGRCELPEGFDSIPLEVKKIVLADRDGANIALHQKEKSGSFGIIPVLIFVAVVIGVIRKFSKKNAAPAIFSDNNHPEETPVSNGQLVYEGNDLNFTDDILTEVLTKHFHSFNYLVATDKTKFLHRLKKFMDIKTFVIHDVRGFREMPILLSATAIKLSFGLSKYLLPHFRFIHIFPEEFIGVSPTLRVLAGNVSGNRIHVSWKHFLEGFKYPDDGENVGLHEMAHAYYFQNFETGDHEDDNFVTHFPAFNQYGNKVFEQEKMPGNDFYSEYALKNLQEFWAESVERFFEKPVQLQAAYPDLYKTLSELLNQDPAADAV